MELQILLMDGSQEVIHLSCLVTLKIHHSQPISKSKPQTQTQTQTQIPKPNLIRKSKPKPNPKLKLKYPT